MSFKTKVALAILLSMALVHNSAGYEPRLIQSLPQTAFREVVIYEPSVQRTPVPTATPTPTVKTTPVPTPIPTPKPKKILLGRSLTGTASFYCNRDRSRGPLSRCTRGYAGGYYAAIRKDLLNLRGKTIKVCVQRDCIPVKIIDCNCGPGANLIDLYGDAFAHFYPLSKGRFKVTIRW